MRADSQAGTQARRRALARGLCALLMGAAVPCLAPGCAAPVYVITAGLAVAQVGTTAYTNGELQTSLFVDFAAAVEAARAAETSLDLRPSALRYEGRKAMISATDLGDRSITVEITRVTSRVCKVSIRVGFWGDQSMSRLVLSQVQKELADLGYAPPPVTIVPAEDPGALENQEQPASGGNR